MTMKIKHKRQAGNLLGRELISKRIILIANQIAQCSYKDTIELGARIAELIDATGYDEYWSEKASIGRNKEQNKLNSILENPSQLDRLASQI